MLVTALALILLVLVGAALAWSLQGRRSILEALGLGIGLGAGVGTFVAFLLLRWPFRLDLGLMALALGLVLAAALLLAVLEGRRPRPARPGAAPTAGPALGQGLLRAGLVIALAYPLLVSLEMSRYWPVYATDALTEYDARARIMIESGDLSILALKPYYVVHPLLTSLTHSWVYLLGAAVGKAPMLWDRVDYLRLSHGMAPHLIYVLYYAGLVASLYVCVRRRCGAFRALVAAAITATTPMAFLHSTIAYTNLPFGYYISLAAIYLHLWLVESRRGDLWLSGLLVGLASWTRAGSELFALGMFVPLALAGRGRRDAKGVLGWTALYLVFYLPWKLHVAGLGYRGDFYAAEAALPRAVGKVLEVLRHLWMFMLNREMSGLVWPCFLVACGLAAAHAFRKRAPAVDYYPMAMTLWCLASWVAYFSLAPDAYVSVYLRVSGERTLLTFLPLAVYALVVNPPGSAGPGPSSQRAGEAGAALDPEPHPRPSGVSTLVVVAAVGAWLALMAWSRKGGGYLGLLAGPVASASRPLVVVDEEIRGLDACWTSPWASEVEGGDRVLWLGDGPEQGFTCRLWSGEEREVVVGVDVSPAKGRAAAPTLAMVLRTGFGALERRWTLEKTDLRETETFRIRTRLSQGENRLLLFAEGHRAPRPLAAGRAQAILLREVRVHPPRGSR